MFDVACFIVFLNPNTYCLNLGLKQISLNDRATSKGLVKEIRIECVRLIGRTC